MVSMKCYVSREAWLSGRTSKIGGSDAASIIGMNPWKDNVTLWKEKMGLEVPEDISNKPVVKYGNDAEPLLRKLFELDHPELKVYYRENNMWTNDKYPFAHASLDGWLLDQDGRKGIFECKTTEIQRSEQWDKWDDKVPEVPDNYYCQLLHYMAVTEFDFAILKAQIKYRKNGNVLMSTREYRFEKSDCEEDIKCLMEAEERFAESLSTGTMPSMILP